MVIYNGPVRTVHYVYSGVSPSEEASIRELQRAENEVVIADQLQELRLQYVTDERALEAHRRNLQELLYGYSSTTEAMAFAGFGTYPGYGVTGGYFYPGFGTYSGGYSPYYGAPGTAFAGYTGTASNSLANGVGDEGVVKAHQAKTMADLGNPDYGARANANLSAALAQASHHEATRAALGLKGPIALAGAAGPESRFGVKPGDQVTVTVRIGNKTEEVKGKVRGEDPEWLTLDTGAQEEMLRSSEVVRVVKPKK
jgi:hypothetical protein